ncbi:MAG: DUF1743 domain-containing protein [Candidatus Methanofastidiosa archaeon]|nr:DUF1743 domain-containing protein [Candidatus Methanofastidiosa archaeon]
MFVGIDDTDSPNGMCTTFICKMIMDELPPSCHIIDFPRLIRLNPNIPYKTRGNGALSFEVAGDPNIVVQKAKEIIKRYVVMHPNTNPGIVILEDDVPIILNEFYEHALHDHVAIEEAHSLAKELGARSLIYGNGRGLIGALASIGAVLPDFTYELIAYRLPENIGKKRAIDKESVKKLDRKYYPLIFDSYDWHNDYLAIAPNAPCPVLYGLRGNDWRMLQKASEMIISEPVFKSQIFLTNQATDAHIKDMPLGQLEEYMSVHSRAKVSGEPHYEHKGHVFFTIEDDTGEMICAAYEPTKEFRNIVSQLIPGDEIEVWGGVKATDYGMTLNLEKIKIVDLVPIYANIVPLCCGRKMNSVGREKGYRCKQCGIRIDQSDVSKRKVERASKLGLYEVPVIARRHLAKPISRI